MPITIRPNDISGVLLIAWSDPAFSSALAAFPAGAALDGAAADVLPYSVILKNTGPRRILGVLRRYVITKADGRTQVMNLRTGALENPHDALAPGASVFLSPSSSLNVKLNATGSCVVAGAGLDRWLPVFQAARSIDLSLDSVIFDDGEFAGPDRAQYFREIHETRRARKDFAALASEHTDDLESWLESQKKDELAGRASPTPDFYGIEWDVLARSSLVELQAAGPAIALDTIRNLAQQPDIQLFRK